MSALGQKQTYAPQNRMSALPPIATAKAKFRKRPCLLYPRKRTCAAQTSVPALGHKRTHAAQQTNIYSNTSSARPISVLGTLRPSALAVLRLMTSSTFVDCTTGKSAGLSPLRIRPV
jgi:hypothetical protein